MTEVEATEFNPELKKKKKKKAMDLDGELAEQTTELNVGDKAAAGTEDLALDDNEFELPLKKKKKKDTAPKTEDAEGLLNDEEFSLPMKKKKKKKKSAVTSVDVDMETGTADDAGATSSAKPIPVEGALEDTPEAEYKYEDLLTRVYDTLKARNPDYVAGERRRFVMKPPEVVRVSARKTAFANFTEIVKLMHRQQDHVMAFMLAELGTTGTLDGNQQLVVKARFQQKQIENVLRRYIREYVTCHTCRSPNTILTKEDRLFYLTCETCHARCTVAPIKSGYVAFTGRRSAQRRAAGN